MLPLMVFADAGPVSNTNSSFVRVWYSLLGLGSGLETQIIIGTGLKEAAKPDHSWRCILESFERLAQIKPDTWGGVLLFVGCDLEYACNVLGLSHFNNTANCCADCNANFDTVPLNNFHRTSAWRGTVRNNEGYLAALRQPRHPLVAHAWFTKFAYRQDLLHNFDHHGLTSHIIGNVLWCHVSSDRLCNVFPGNTTDERLDCMNDDIRAFYSAQRVNNRLPTLKASNLKKNR